MKKTEISELVDGTNIINNRRWKLCSWKINSDCPKNAIMRFTSYLFVCSFISLSFSHHFRVTCKFFFIKTKIISKNIVKNVQNC